MHGLNRRASPRSTTAPNEALSSPLSLWRRRTLDRRKCKDSHFLSLPMAPSRIPADEWGAILLRTSDSNFLLRGILTVAIGGGPRDGMMLEAQDNTSRCGLLPHHDGCNLDRYGISIRPSSSYSLMV